MIRYVMTFVLLIGSPCAAEPIALPKSVPPVLGMATASNDTKKWSIELRIPKITWEVVGDERPKKEWPEFKVDVEERVMMLSMDYPEATQLADHAQNRVVDLKGRRLNRAEASEFLKDSTPVLVSVTGAMPDPFFLQCTKPDTLVVILGIPESPAPRLLPQPKKTSGASSARADTGKKG